jgi:anion-transporting  ArsA/GET3 family ATPase
VTVVVNELTSIIGESRVIVCCGPGGVGKTTTAAALAVEGARRGRRTCVVTIDPARRLADALGLDSLTNTPRRVDGPWGGELWALMLDTKSTFDDAITRYARDENQARSILGSQLYRNVRDAISGTQEYMAVEKLYQLVEEGGFDLIVVDTPPTRRAIDFLDAPRHLTLFLGNPAIRMSLRPSRAYFRIITFAAQAPLKIVANIVGAETLVDTVDFLRAFEGMEDGIYERAKRIGELFAEPTTAFLLVVTPRDEAINEGRFFTARLHEADIPVQALVINRLHPHFDTPSAATPRILDSSVRGRRAQAFADLNANWSELRIVAQQEERTVADLAAQVAPASVARVPLLDGDVHDLDQVQIVADHLFGLSSRTNASRTVKSPRGTLAAARCPIC